MRLLSLMLLSVGLLAATAVADEPTKVADFSLTDVNGKKHVLSDYREAKAVVLMFIATQCPVSNAYNERMAAIEREYRDRGIVFLGINSNKQESVDEIRDHAAKHGFGFPVLKDEKNVIADRLQASFTPEIYVVDPSLTVVYHGRIDDSQRPGRVTTSDLRAALNEILAGKPVTVSRTKAFGCTIKRVE